MWDCECTNDKVRESVAGRGCIKDITLYTSWCVCVCACVHFRVKGWM